MMMIYVRGSVLGYKMPFLWYQKKKKKKKNISIII